MPLQVRRVCAWTPGQIRVHWEQHSKCKNTGKVDGFQDSLLRCAPRNEGQAPS
ncbi:Hypothetical protein AA314_00675 [Archangium gephyra]|uniref:Uncharacterized protein n=1 Tax=Archangium gephyra TaxID=48 RepID=A0AAC8Q2E8_9BACT|nr:Hypothetical protein AA314_00675 [Archangium gephyra]